jgi:hypothetical protein
MATEIVERTQASNQEQTLDNLKALCEGGQAIH